MGNTNRNRGFGFEREVVNLAKSLGYDAKRAWGSDGRSLGLTADVDILIDNKPYQCKRKKSLAVYLKPSGNNFGNIVREDRGETYLIIRLEDYLKECHKIEGE